MRLGISQYGARILELRAMGFTIENISLGMVDGVRHTEFRLVSEPSAYALPLHAGGPVKKEQYSPEESQGQLFDAPTPKKAEWEYDLKRA